MYVANHLSSERLRRIAKQQTQARLLLRLQAVVLAQEGHTAPEIAKILSVTYRTVQYWIQRYNRRGLDGLRDLRRGGNQRKLTDQQEQKINRLAIDAIRVQQEHVRKLMLNARFELARIYDKLAVTN